MRESTDGRVGLTLERAGLRNQQEPNAKRTALKLVKGKRLQGRSENSVIIQRW